MREGKAHVLNMSEGNPVKLLLTFSVPLFLGNLLQQFYNLADTSIAGHIQQTREIAATLQGGQVNHGII